VSSLTGLGQFLLRLPRTDVLGYSQPSLRDSVQSSHADSKAPNLYTGVPAGLKRLPSEGQMPLPAVSA
jgi:hypothetical protein